MKSNDTQIALKDGGRRLMLSNHTMEAFAEKATPKQAEFLLDLFACELSYREENKKKRLKRKAAFPIPKTFDGYDFTPLALPDTITREELIGCDFAARNENLILYGPVGTGKTHCSIAIGNAACEMGLSVRFTTTSELVLKLGKAREDGTLDRLLRDYSQAHIVILDEFGYVPIDRDGARLLFQIVSQCYEARSLILTTNLEFSKWGSVLTEDQMASAMIDRLMHHGHVITFSGESYRIRHALMSKGGGKNNA